MQDENVILNRLVIDEKDATKDLERLVNEAGKYFRIEKTTGKIFFQNFGALTDKQRISIVLVGKYFAVRMGLIDASELSISDIAKELGRPMTALSGAIKELVIKGYAERLPGRKYRVVYHRLDEIFADILSAKGGK